MPFMRAFLYVCLLTGSSVCRVQTVERAATVTAYCPCATCCNKPGGPDGRTATLSSAFRRGIAVDPKRIPYGAYLFIPGYGFALADDTGSAMRSSRGLLIDIRLRTHAAARNWGSQALRIIWWKP